MIKKPVCLIILDGYGIGKNYKGNSQIFAKKPTIDLLFENYPHSQLEASGEKVGLPDGQMGNSEVGHLNIGSGRIIYQDLTKITREIKNGDFFKNEAFLKAIEYAKKNNSNIHLMGLVSRGGVHSHIEHLYALIDLMKEHDIGDRTFIDVILDGRDVAPDAGLKDIMELEDKIKNTGVRISSLSGRYYAMDRDKRWDRTKLYYEACVMRKALSFKNASDIVKESYKNGKEDEFILPAIVDNGTEYSGIKENDAIIFFNFRPDRARQISKAITDPNFSDFERKYFKTFYVCMTMYDESLRNVEIAYKKEIPHMVLGEVMEKENKKQLRIAETEKYAHVTYFFNGGREDPFKGEDRVLIPSPKVATYDLKPEMSAYEVCDELLKRLDEKKYDLVVLNFANTDMVGHTGVMSAAVKAIEAVDVCLNKIIKKLKEVGACALITADHGNCEEMLTEDGEVLTSHTVNPVPFILFNGGNYGVKNGILADIAPTILDLMNINKPQEMTGESLLIKEEEKCQK